MVFDGLRKGSFRSESQCPYDWDHLDLVIPRDGDRAFQRGEEVGRGGRKDEEEGDSGFSGRTRDPQIPG